MAINTRSDGAKPAAARRVNLEDVTGLHLGAADVLQVLHRAAGTHHPVDADRARAEGTQIDGPAIVTTRVTTYLVEPGWTFRAVAQGGAWFIRNTSH